jgi:hypothetical protein
MGDHETWKCADPELEKQIRCFPYIARSVVDRLQATLSMPLNDRGISDYLSMYLGKYNFTTCLHCLNLYMCPTIMCASSRSTTEGAIYGNNRICLTAIGSAHFHVSWLSDFIFYHKPYINRFTNHISSHHAMRCSHHSVSIARSRV